MTVTEPVDTPDQLSDETLPANAVLVIVQEGQETSDNRIVEPGALEWRDPLSLMSSHYSDDVVAKVTPIGRVSTLAGLTVDNLADKISTAGDYIVGLCTFDLGYDGEGNLLNPAAPGREVARMVQGGFLTGASMEPGGNAEVELDCIEYEQDEYDPEFEYCVRYQQRLTKGIIIAVAMEARQAIDSAGITDVGAPPVAEPVAASARPAWWWSCPNPTAGPVVASAVAARPTVVPADAFEMPEPDEYTPFTVDGWRCFGHIAPWNLCHVGITRYCQTCPRSSTGYDVFHQLPITTDKGIMRVGLLCTDSLHGELYDDDGEPIDAYTAQRIAFEDPRARAAYLHATEGEHGLWVSGVLHEQISDRQLADIESTPVSGHWAPLRMADGSLVGQELITVNCVNAPGYPNAKVLTASAAPGQPPTVVAMFAQLTPRVGCGCDEHGNSKPVTASARSQDGPSTEQRLAYLEQLVSEAGLSDVALERMGSRISG